MATISETFPLKVRDYRSNSLWRLTLRRIFKQRSAVIGLTLLLTLLLIAAFAPLIAPYNPNQVLIGIVNAARGHFRMAVDDLVHAHDRWPGHLERLITHRYAPADAATALHGHPEDEIKAVVEWGHAGGDRGRDHGTG